MSEFVCQRETVLLHRSLHLAPRLEVLTRCELATCNPQ
jgi:hypothetical protein